MDQIKTIRIEHEGFPDGMLINESDFDPQEHTKFGETAEAELKMTVAELRAFAKDHGITLGADATTKDAILSVIQAAGFKLNAFEPKEGESEDHS
jgi:hypothetical protein